MCAVHLFVVQIALLIVNCEIHIYDLIEQLSLSYCESKKPVLHSMYLYKMHHMCFWFTRPGIMHGVSIRYSQNVIFSPVLERI